MKLKKALLTFTLASSMFFIHSTAEARMERNDAFNAFAQGNANALKDIIYYAKKGDIEAQVALALLYRRGYSKSGVKKDIKKSIYWYEQAAKQGDVGSSSSLGMIYLGDEGVPRNVAKAKKYLREGCYGGQDTSCMLLQKLE